MGILLRTPSYLIVLFALTLVAPWTVSQTLTEGEAPPSWLIKRIKTFESGPANHAPYGIWQITHNGRPAYYFRSPCCDQYNPLIDDTGVVMCNPDGGKSGKGDGRCSNPADPNTKVRLVWVHPRSAVKTPLTPFLSKR